MQVLSLMEYPDLLKDENISKTKELFPPDAIDRAKEMYTYIVSVGAYSVSKGIDIIRRHVAEYIKARDGYDADVEDIYLTSGASQGVNYLLQIAISSPNAGIMIPIPQYPLYSATIALLGGKQVDYFLDEQSNWSLKVEDLESSFQKAKKEGINIKAIAVINPGNPTGACLPEETIAEILRFCGREGVICLADEVYQTNIFDHDARPFISFKKTLRDLQKNGECMSNELVSFHSTSKGMIGECGQRGGYFELVGIDPKVKEQIYKLASINLCPPVIGQMLVDLMVKPPKEGDYSYEKYTEEHNAIDQSLYERAKNLKLAFSKMEGLECQDAHVRKTFANIIYIYIYIYIFFFFLYIYFFYIFFFIIFAKQNQGAMYLFPKIKLPPKAMEAAKKEGRSPDEFYCMKMLEMAGVATVP